MEKNILKIYKIKNYFTSKDENDEYKCKHFEGPIDDILKKLDKNKGYNIRINPENYCICYGDLDHLPNEELFKTFLNLVCEYFEVKLEQISYTLSKKENEFSYHWSIPSIYSKPKYLKEFMRRNFNDFVKKSYVDLSIYSKRLFRLPNQTTEDKPLKHNIIQGKMQDFLIEYINNASYELDFYETDERKKDKKESSKFSYDNNDNALKIAYCLNCLHNYRCDNFEDWRTVAFAIYDKLEENGLELFDDWSSRSDKYDEAKVRKFYNNIKKREDGISLGTLMMMAKEDNPELYKTYFNKKKFEINISGIEKTYSCNERDIAEYLIEKYLKDKYICVLLKPMKFYYFNGVKWTEDKSNNKLFKIINFDLEKEYMDELKSANDDQTKLINKILKKLKGKLSFIDGIIEWISRLLFNIDILKLFDENQDLMGFNNGVYEFSKKLFRDALPSDYITKTTGYDFPINDKGFKVSIDKFLNQVFPDPEIKKYVLQLQAQSLCGNKIKDLVLTHSGRGGNGKSILSKLLSDVFGEYFIEIPTSMITSQNKGTHNTPDPFLSEIQGCRLAIANEPKSGLRLNDSLVKIFASQEPVKYRMLYSNDPITLKTQIKLNIVCNNKLEFDGNDGGLTRRLKVIKYISKFDEKPNEKNNIYKIDYNLSKSVSEWKEDYMKMLIELYNPNFIYEEPSNIKKWSNDYCEDNNDVSKFVKENFIMTNNQSDYLLLKDLKLMYQQNKEYNQLKLKNLKEFLEKEFNSDFKEKTKIKNNGKWIDIRNAIFGWKKIIENDDSDIEDEKSSLDI